MKTTLLGLATLSLGIVSFTSDASAATAYHLGTLSATSVGSSSCQDIRDDYWITDPVSHKFDTNAMTLPQGVYRPMLAGGQWRITKSANFKNTWLLYSGYVKAEIIEVAVFGAETVRSTFVRGIANFGYEDTKVPLDQDFAPFYVPGNNGSSYKLRITTWAQRCTKSQFNNVAVELMTL
jgi:hypothetical protein